MITVSIKCDQCGGPWLSQPEYNINMDETALIAIELLESGRKIFCSRKCEKTWDTWFDTHWEQIVG